jgi:uncharacterized Zn-binding protein involved in type VI secretion
MDGTEDEGQRLAAEFLAKLAARPVKATYDLATLGGKTRQGGEVVTASTDMVMAGHRIACVGDVVRYQDGTESKIVSDAGAALAYMDRPVAIVGSTTDNGDTIVSSLQSSAQIQEYADDGGIPGLLQPGYVPPTKEGAGTSSVGFDRAIRPLAAAWWRRASLAIRAVECHTPTKALAWPAARTA